MNIPAIPINKATIVITIIAVSWLIGVLGRRRKMGFWGYFFGSILLTPIIGLLLVLASDPKPKK